MRVALVTGASRGIGAGIADLLLEEGWRVLGACRSKPRSEIEHLPCDFRNLNALEKTLKELSQSMTPELIVCAAGIGRFHSAEGFSTEQIESLMRVNFSAHAVMLGALLPSMKTRRLGRVIFIGSEAGLQGARLGSIYCASKFALRGYSQSLRIECRSAGIGVSLINPGLVRTEFHNTAGFRPAPGEQHALSIQDVCDCVKLLLTLPPMAVIEEINLQPMQPQIVKSNPCASSPE
jgi:3-hydroxy acid dehydrogenase/malonic semialdehyde reductase